MESPGENNNKRFDWDKLLAESLNYAQHGRLILLLLCAGCLMGVVYFVYATPLYSSAAMIKIDHFGIPISEETGADVGTPGYLLNRRLLTYLGSEQFIKRVAVENGWATEETNAAGVRERIIPLVRYNWLDSDTMEVTVMSPYPVIVREFTQSLIEVYREEQRKNRAEHREKGIKMYLDELEGLRGQLDEGMDRRFDFEKESGLTDLYFEQRNLKEVPRELVLVRSRTEQLERGLEQLGAASEDTDIAEKLALLVAIEEEALDINDIGAFERINEGSSPLVDKKESRPNKELLMQPQSLEPWETWERERRGLVEDLERESQTYLSDHPIIRDLNAKIADLNQRLQSEYELQLKRLQVEKGDLQRREKELQAQMPDYEKVTREYEEFRRDYSLLTRSELSWDKMFTDMAQRIAALEYGADKERMELSFAGYVNLRDENPVSPNKSKLLMISVALGAGLAFGVPFLLNISNTTTSRIKDLEQASGLPGMGAVPLTNQEFLEEIVRSPMLGATVPNALLENFRLIRSNICLHPNRKGDTQVVMVTSARPGEGKSTQAANLAWAFFSMGERTLLIDCDLRRGRQHNLCRVENAPGLTSLLTQQSELKDVILKTENENLDVIPRGPVIAGTTEVLCQRYFDDVIAELRKHYHRIVIDTPPVLGLSETSSLQRITDGVSLVVRADVTPRRDTLDAVEKLRKAGAHIFGFVLNGIDLNKMANRYHYYYYSANYYDSFEPPQDFNSNGSGIKLEGSGTPKLRRKDNDEHSSRRGRAGIEDGVLGSVDPENSGA